MVSHIPSITFKSDEGFPLSISRQSDGDVTIHGLWDEEASPHKISLNMPPKWRQPTVPQIVYDTLNAIADGEKFEHHISAVPKTTINSFDYLVSLSTFLNNGKIEMTMDAFNHHNGIELSKAQHFALSMTFSIKAYNNAFLLPLALALYVSQNESGLHKDKDQPFDILKNSAIKLGIT